MKPNKILTLLFLFSIAFFLPNASAQPLFGKDYLQTLDKHLTQSKDSITVAMYFIIITPEDNPTPANQLVNSLIAAKNRGVKIKVILKGTLPKVPCFGGFCPKTA
jgi:phosphatidylserine/phosphatidylglycerophosphate/cardiolipin synthase-like enzyme